MEAAYWILRYLKLAHGKGILFRKSEKSEWKPILMLIRQVLSLTEDTLVGVKCSLEAVLSHEEARNKHWWPNQVQKTNSDQWLKVYINYLG